MTERKRKQTQFFSFIEEKNDRIDRAAFKLLCLLATSKAELDESAVEPPIDWDMEIIGELIDCAEKIMVNQESPVCRPFLEGDEEIPCYLGIDCKRKDCLFRKEKNHVV